MKAALVLLAAGILFAAVFHQEKAGDIPVSGGPETQGLLKAKEMTHFRQVTMYYSDQEKPLLNLTKQTLNDAEDLSRTLFQNLRLYGIDLVFFSSRKEIEAFSRLSKRLSNITGFYSDEARMIGLLPEERERLLKGEGFAVFLYERVLIHEYTHYAFHEKLRELGSEPGDYPLWFHEGVAEWAAAHDTAYVRALPAVVPFAKLETDRQWKKMREEYEADIYLQSYYMIDELVRKKGKSVILDIMKETAEGKTFEQGFKAAVNEDISQFEEEFRRKYDHEEKTALGLPMPFSLLMNGSLLPCAFGWHLHLALDRGVKGKHFLHVLGSELRNLIIAVLVLINKNFVGHFNIMRNLVCQHPSANRVCHFRSSHRQSRSA